MCRIAALLLVALSVAAPAIASPSVSPADPAASPAPAGTPPPQIYRIITRPLCSRLHDRIAPAVGMMLQNDTTIAKSPSLFEQYNRASLLGSDDSQSDQHGMNGGVPMNGESAGGTMNDAQNMALLGMENLIRPIANNVIAVQKVLDSPALSATTGNAGDDKRLQTIRAKLLSALAVQSASLDIISGFVDTQQMGDLQHAGQEYVNALNQPDSTAVSTPAPIGNPLLQNPNQAGLPPNPYDVNLAAIPGLTLGYNPVTRLIGALHWTMKETAVRENAAAQAVMDGAAACSGTVLQP